MSSVLLPCSVNITVKDINGNTTASQFNAVYSLNFDYARRTVNIVDTTGSFFFDLSTITTLTYTVNGTVTTVVMS